MPEIDIEWLSKLVDLGIDTFKSIPLERRVEYGTIIVITGISCFWVLPALGRFIRDIRSR